MCRDKTTMVKLNTARPSGRLLVPVDSCIAAEVQKLNDAGILTLSCCCGHGKAGQIEEWENGFGKWKSRGEAPHILIEEQSIQEAKDMGYRPFPYYYADGEFNGVWQMHLKTGCLTEVDCEEWQEKEERRTPLG